MSETVTLADVEASYNELLNGSNQFFLLITGCFVLLMQTGFAFQEAGLVQEKNVVNILIKNLMDACVGAWLYWLIGYGLAYGDPTQDSWSFCGLSKFALADVGIEEYGSFFFQYTFAATGVTIVSGTMAERVSFYGYIIYGCLLSGYIYPIATHWGWTSSGWLATLGYKDFAGSGLVHVVGGSAALVGGILLGPRRGRYSYEPLGDGRSKRIVHEMPKNNIPFAILGTFILFFGFLAFNGGSQLAILPAENAYVVMLAVVNTVISGGSGAIIGLLLSWYFSGFKLFSLMTTSCGCLGGLVSICGVANDCDPWIALVIGCVGGAIACYSAKYLAQWGVDDPVDAISIHLGGGIWGVVAVGFFSKSAGVCYGHGGQQLVYNMAGAFFLIAWTVGNMAPIFATLKYFGLLRVTEQQEIEGLDKHKHGELAYEHNPGEMADLNISRNNISIHAEYSARHISLSKLNLPHVASAATVSGNASDVNMSDKKATIPLSMVEPSVEQQLPSPVETRNVVSFNDVADDDEMTPVDKGTVVQDKKGSLPVMHDSAMWEADEMGAEVPSETGDDDLAYIRGNKNLGASMLI